MISSRSRIFKSLAIIAASTGTIWPAAATPARNCDPVEVAPGVRQPPRGFALRSKPAEPKRDAHEFRIGNTELRVGGRVRTEYGFRR